MPTPYCYFKGQIVPLEEAKIGVMTHAFNYGTAVFEGVRGNWNPDAQQAFLFRLREHFVRLEQSARILRMATSGSGSARRSVPSGLPAP